MSKPNPNSRADSWAAKSAAHDMQLRTRKKQGFDKTEALLPLIKPQLSLAMKAMDVVGLLPYIGKRNLLTRLVAAGDEVWMLDNVAHKNSNNGWQAEFVAAVFEKESKCVVVDVVQIVAQLIGLADDAEERATIEERILPFLWDLRVGRKFTAVHGDKNMVLGPTDSGGISSNMVSLPQGSPGTIARTTAIAPQGVTGILQSWTYFADPEGWSVISGMYSPSGASPYCKNS